MWRQIVSNITEITASLYSSSMGPYSQILKRFPVQTWVCIHSLWIFNTRDTFWKSCLDAWTNNLRVSHFLVFFLLFDTYIYFLPFLTRINKTGYTQKHTKHHYSHESDYDLRVYVTKKMSFIQTHFKKKKKKKNPMIMLSYTSFRVPTCLKMYTTFLCTSLEKKIRTCQVVHPWDKAGLC